MIGIESEQVYSLDSECKRTVEGVERLKSKISGLPSLANGHT